MKLQIKGVVLPIYVVINYKQSNILFTLCSKEMKLLK